MDQVYHLGQVIVVILHLVPGRHYHPIVVFRLNHLSVLYQVIAVIPVHQKVVSHHYHLSQVCQVYQAFPHGQVIAVYHLGQAIVALVLSQVDHLHHYQANHLHRIHLIVVHL